MIRSSFFGTTLALLASIGCTGEYPRFGVGRPEPTRNVAVLTPDKLTPSSQEVATRVDSLGRRILSENKDIAIKPIFSSFGVPDLSIFHRGTVQICISDGLVNKCKTEAELAAVLCSELGKMVSEAHDQRPGFEKERERALTPAIGSDIVGGGGDPDRTRLAEQAYYEKQNPRSRGGAVLLPERNPSELSRQYLANSGFSADDLAKVSPLLRLAESNPKYEKLLGGSTSSAGNPVSP